MWGIHLGGVEWRDGSVPTGRTALSPVVGRVPGVVSGRRRCLDYLDWLRWPQGFVCPECAHPLAWELADGRYECRECHERSSATAGTIFDKTRTPLTVWFMACWLFSSQKDGISALSVERRCVSACRCRCASGSVGLTLER